MGITSSNDRTPKRVESETGGNSSPSIIGNREMLVTNPSLVDKDKRSVVNKKGSKNKKGTMDKEKGRALSQDRKSKGKDFLPTLKKKVPFTTAVGVTCLNKELTYEEILKKARENVSLSSLDINKAKIKRAMTGGVIIEIAEDENGRKADRLRENLEEVFDTSKIKVSRPMKRTSMRLSGIDDSIIANEIRNELSLLGNCPLGNVNCSEVKFLRGN